MLRRAAFLACILIAPSAAAQEIHDTEQAVFAVETVAEGLEIPWAIAFLPNGDMLVTEREGRLRLIQDGELAETPVSGLPDDLIVIRQGGLMDVALHPEFQDNRLVYFTYSEGTEQENRTVLARGVLSGDGLSLSSVEDLFAANFDKRNGFHFGGRILFNEDDTLFLTFGDGGRYQDEAQNPANHLGALVRLTWDGEPAPDNPDFGPDAAPGLFSYGHRNIQGIDRNPVTGTVMTHEHGARGGDELNLATPGGNHGWPAITYGINYNGTIISERREQDGMEQPIWYWNPSIAPSGMAFYDGEAFEHWSGDLFVSALAGMAVQRLEMDGDRVIGVEPLLTERNERYRDVRVGPDGALYVLVDDIDGAVLRLVPAEAD